MACQPFGQVARQEKKALVKNRGEKIQLLRDVERINKISPCVPIIYFIFVNLIQVGLHFFPLLK